MPKMDIAGSTMYYLDRGQGVPIVLLHSYLGSAFMWAPQISAFEDDFRLIAPDIWGHGNSGNLPEGTNDLAGVAQHVLMLLDALKVEKYILIGQSIGGMLAGEIALHAPHKVIALALVGTYLGREPELAKKHFLGLISDIEKQEQFSISVIEELERLFFVSNNKESSLRLKAAFRNELNALTRVRVLQSMAPIGRMIFDRRDMCPHLAPINAATTIVMCGRYDLVRPPDEAKRMAALIGCRYLEVPNAGHTPNLESPELVTTALTEFIHQTLNKKSSDHSEKG